MGVTSSQLFSLDQIASLTGDRPLGIAVQATQQKCFEQAQAVLQRKHCYVCEVEFGSRFKFTEHCRKMHDVTGCKGKTTMRDFEKDNTENRIKKLKYRKKMVEDAKYINDNKKRNDILMKKERKKERNASKEKENKLKLRNLRNEARISSPLFLQKNDESMQNAFVKTPTRKMVVFYCPHCQEGFRTKEKKEAHARKMTCYFNSVISFKPGCSLIL